MMRHFRPFNQTGSGVSLMEIGCLDGVLPGGSRVVAGLVGVIDPNGGQGHLQVHSANGEVWLCRACQHVLDGMLGVV